ncbi:hypothetical protein [Paraburkholderia caribensis]|uniref:hypothetical protein n=1 Tax=Paraburkholderia caribensis TaxID=75105 RepID=UPI00078DBDCA|nr:hypothetical protein [Paraburkholderia caribensis]AMV41744.1 hypothetical protein ATN79_03475 [Paraburkholderia caribensis]
MNIDNATPEPGTATCRTLQSPPPLFRLGQIVATRGVLKHLEHRGIAADPYLRRHVTGDWGAVPPEDARSNRFAVEHGARILSSYDIAGERVWIITEADRSATTLLFPSEY